MKIALLLLIVIMWPAALAAEAPSLSVGLISTTPDPVQPGQAVDVVLQIANSGDPTDDAWLEIVEDYPFTVLPGGDAERAQNLRVVSGTQKLQFRLEIAEDAQDGPAPLRVIFGEDRDTPGQNEVTFTMQIETFGARMGIDRVEQAPSSLQPGQQGTVALTLTNYDDQPLHNLDVMLDLTNSHDANSNMDNSIAVQAMINARLENVNRRIAAGQSPLTGATPMGVAPDGKLPLLDFTAFAPVGTSTLRRIGTLDPGQTVTLVFDIQALPEATAGIHATAVFVNYNDEDNNPFHTRSEIPLSIDAPPEPMVQLKSSTLRSTDFAGEVTVLVANTGLAPMRYATLEILPDDAYRLITAPSEVYLATLEPGAQGEAAFSILPEEENLTLPVRLRYRDAYNNEVIAEETLHLEIINRNYYRDMPYEMMAPWIILGLVLLALTWYFLSRLRKQ